MQPLDDHRSNIGFRIARSHPLAQEFVNSSPESRRKFCDFLYDLITDPNYTYSLGAKMTESRKAYYNTAKDLPWEVVFFDHEYMLASSNHLVFFVANTPVGKMPYSRLHLVPFLSCLLTMKSATDPISDQLVEELLDLDSKCSQKSWQFWLYQKPGIFEKALINILGEKTFNYLKDTCLNTLENLEKDRLCNYPHLQHVPFKNLCEDLCNNPDVVEILTCVHIELPNISAKTIIRSLITHTKWHAYSALWDRMDAQTYYLNTCKLFKKDLTANQWVQVFEHITKNIGVIPMPSTQKQQILHAIAQLGKTPDVPSLTKIKESIKPWLTPSYRTLACCMYPLLADALILYEALQAKRIIGNYVLPLESIVYLHLKPLCTGERLTRLTAIKDDMLKNICPEPMSLLKNIFQELQNEKTPISFELELQNIINATENRDVPLLNDIYDSIWDPDQLTEKYLSFFPPQYQK